MVMVPTTGVCSAVVGTLAAQVVSEAILRAVDSAAGGYGLPARRDLPWARD